MLKKNYWAFLLFLFIVPCSQNLYSQYYKLVWSDEFNGTEINDSVWTHEIGGQGWGNSEMQYYTDRTENSFVSNGKLFIRAIKEKFNNNNYTSARLITKDKISFQYGKIEASIRLPYGQGIWPAFWMMGQNFSEVGWPKCGEIDIMEMIGGSGRENTSHGTVHWDNSGHASYGGEYTLKSGTFSDAFHTFSIIWEPESIRWYVDDNLFHQIDITPADLSEFHQEFFILLNLAVGGNWPGYPNSETEFPQLMEVDFVRVYQLSNLYPEISLTTPLPNSKFNVNDDIELVAEVDFADEIDKVEFYQGAALIGETRVAPYKMTWENIESGSYRIKAKTYSTAGISGETDIININVGDEAERSSYLGYYHKVPGVIEAENFDLGNHEIAYEDKESENRGSSYRNSGVDIEVCEDLHGGFNVGWIEADEWLSYSIDVAETDKYVFTVRAASQGGGGAFKILVNDSDKTGNVVVSSTGGWQNWSDIKTDEIMLEKGKHDLKIYFTSGNFNLNKISVYKKNAEESVTLISPNGGEVFTIGSVEEIIWTSQLVDKVRLRYSTNGGSTWQTIRTDKTSRFGVYRWLVPNDLSDQCIIAVQNEKNLSTYDLSDTEFQIAKATRVKDDPIKNLQFVLKQNYPNPFNPETVIEYEIPGSGESKSNVLLQIYDILGNKIKTLVDKHQSSGTYKIAFNASDLRSGVYFYKLTKGSFSITKKMCLLK